MPLTDSQKQVLAADVYWLVRKERELSSQLEEANRRRWRAILAAAKIDAKETLAIVSKAESDAWGGDAPEPDESHLVALTARAEAAERERDALAKFKSYVHHRLDLAAVPTHPDGPHGKDGCRIGDRLDWVIQEMNRQVEKIDQLTAERDEARVETQQWKASFDATAPALREATSRAEMADYYEQWLLDLGRISGCEHLDERLPRCVREEFEKVAAERDEARAALREASRDISEWLQLAKRQYAEMPKASHNPLAPTEYGIAASEAVLKNIALALRGRDAGKAMNQ